jgi:hypothetical protein
MNPEALFEAPVSWVAEAGPVYGAADNVADGSAGAARVLFTRFITRRNFSGFPFWVSCPPETCALLAERARDLAAATAGFETGITLETLTPEAIGILRERMLLPERPASFPGKRGFKMLFPGIDPAEHALFGETEHWTRIRTQAGLPNAEETVPLLALEEKREQAEGPPFSRSSTWGWLTSDPAFAGNGLQCEAGLHLPALTAARKIPQVRQAMAAMGLELQPLSLRNPGAAEAGFFRLLTRGGMDLSSEELYRRFAGRVTRLLDAETEAWTRWNAREGNLLEDRMHRALRLLQEARRMEFAEFLLLCGYARTGVYGGIFPISLLPRLEDLRVKAQPFHLGGSWRALNPAANASEALPVEEENVLRAGLGRSALAAF